MLMFACTGHRLGNYKGRCQMVVVCGKNEKVQKALKDGKWPANVHVVVQGFVSNMDDWMVASDCREYAYSRVCT